MKKKKKRGIKGKMTIAFVVMGILLSLCVGIQVFSISYSQVTTQYTERAFNTAKTAALLIDGDSIANYLISGKNEEYFAVYEALKEVKITFGLTYLYVHAGRLEDNVAIYVFDIFVEGDNPDHIFDLGHVLDDAEASSFDVGKQTFLTGQIEASTIVSFSEYGWLASAYVPIFTSNGSVAAVLGVDLSMNKIMSDIILQTLQILLLTIAIIIVFLLILRFIAGKQILNPVMQLSKHMDSFDSENGMLNTIEFPESGSEFQTIAKSYNRMISDIKYYMENLETVTADRERIATELDVATEIQTSMLPSTFPAFPEHHEFDIHATMYPAREVGGDFYDFFLIRENTLAVVIADVSDKGIPAALFMVIAKTLIKNTAMNASFEGTASFEGGGKSPKEVFETVNKLLCDNNDTGMFVTAFMGYLDIPSGRFTYVNAGHNPPLLKHDDMYRYMKTDPGLMLGLMEDTVFVQEETVLCTGDMLFLYTDGITEAMNTERSLFTAGRLSEKINLYKTSNPNEIIANIKHEIDVFSDGREQADDITMLALEIRDKK